MSFASAETASREALAEVVRRGYELRRRRLLFRIATIVAGLELLAAIPVLLLQDTSPAVVTTVGSTATTVFTPPPTSPPTTTGLPLTVTTVPAPIGSETTTTTSAPGPAPTTTVAKPAGGAPTTTKVCRNSTDPACGAFRWDPDPGKNEPLTIEMVCSPTQSESKCVIEVGQQITFSIHLTDPDASSKTSSFVEFGQDQTGARRESIEPAPCPERHGPWTPPPRQELDYKVDFNHTYDKPGTYKFDYSATSNSKAYCKGDHKDPYGSSAELAVEVVVKEKPPPPPPS